LHQPRWATRSADSWANLLAGQSGIDFITRFDASNFACKFAGEVKDFNLDEYVTAKEARTMDTFIHYGVAASMQAVADSGLLTGDQLSEEQGHAHRLRDWLGHRRFAADRGHAHRADQPRSTAHHSRSSCRPRSST
jgi:3-oxoacyl-(acyl-carrier-protein) synthase